ncbi:MAG: hypothetical protein ABIR34_07795 [Marmoricola sp.]
MSRPRVWVATALALGALVVAAGGVWAVRAEDPTYSHALVKYDDHHGEPNRYVSLDQGSAQLSIGSPDGHRIVVQWRDPDGRGWTERETVWTEKKELAIENTVRYGGGTVAIRQLYTTDVHDDSDASSHTIGIVCRKLTCTAYDHPGSGGEAQVTPDGRTVYLGHGEKGAYLWTQDDDIHLARWSGHPGFEYGVNSPSVPLLAPDGSLRVVNSRPSREQCTFELLASSPGTADLVPVARSTQRLRGKARSDCRSYLDSDSADWVGTHPDDHRAHDFWFVAKGNTWTTTLDDPSGLKLIDVDRGCCDTAIAGFVHWGEVAYSSPDAHRIQVQNHLLGKETWSRPVTLEGAPAGYRCTWVEGYEVGDEGFAVMMACHSGKVRNAYRGDAYAMAVTPDLRHWESTFVTGVSREPQVDDDTVRVGGTTWTPRGGFVKR